MTHDAREDFQGYMEALQQQQVEMQRMQQMLDAHETWRMTTWQGWMVRQLQALGQHFTPFFETVGDLIVLSSNEDHARGPGQYVVLVLLRTLQVSVVIIVVYTLGRILTTILGKEIVIEQHVVIDEDDDDGDDDKTKIASNTTSRISRTMTDQRRDGERNKKNK